MQNQHTAPCFHGLRPPCTHHQGHGPGVVAGSNRPGTPWLAGSTLLQNTVTAAPSDIWYPACSSKYIGLGMSAAHGPWGRGLAR